MSNQNKGIYLAIVTAVISGVSIFVNKFAVNAVQPAIIFTSVKNIAVGILILCLVLALGKWKEIKSLSREQLKYLIAIGIIGGSLPFYLFFTGLSNTSAINAAIIQKTLVLWVAIFAIPFLKEKISKTQIAAVLMLFSANVFIGGFKGFSFSKWEFFILMATILWAIENVLAKKILPKADSNIVALFRMCLGSIILVVASFITIPNAFQSAYSLTHQQIFWVSLTVLSLFGYVICWYKALSFAPAITVSSILVSSTLVTNVLSAVFITHSWTFNLTLQAQLILIGTFLLIRAKKADLSLQRV